VVWVNATNLFDAACGFGGYRESGYGREGGKEGMYEYLEPAWLHDEVQAATSLPEPEVGAGLRPRSGTWGTRFCDHRPHGEELHWRQAGSA